MIRIAMMMTIVIVMVVVDMILRHHVRIAMMRLSETPLSCREQQ